MSQENIKQIIKESIDKVLCSRTNMLDEYKPNSCNNSPMRSINESNVKRLIARNSDCGYIILSPCRVWTDLDIDLTTPQEREKFNQINRERFVELINILKQQQFTYTPIYGGFIEETAEDVRERALIIYNKNRKGEVISIDELIQFGLQIADKYNKESILFKEPGKNPRYINSNGNIIMEFSEDMEVQDLAKQYFVDLHNNSLKYDISDRKTTRFIFTECYLNPSPQCYGERVTRDYHNEIFISR